MSTVKRIAKNTFAILAGNIIGKIFSLIFTIYIARYLQADGYGTISFALAFVAMFGIFADVGFYELIIREVARDNSLAGKYIGNIAILKLVIVLVFYGVMYLLINLMKYPSETVHIVYILGLSMVLDAFAMLFNAIFQAFEKMEYVSIGKIMKSFLLMFGGLFVIYYKLDIIALAKLYLLVSFIVLIYSIVISVKYFTKPKLEINKKFYKWLIKEGILFWASSVFITMYYNVDKIMLSMIVGNKAVGWYNAAFTLVFSLNFIPLAFFAAIFPITSRLYISSTESLKFAFERSFKYSLIVGMFIGITTMVLSDKIVFLIYGKEYMPSIIILRILIWSLVLNFVSMVFKNLLNSINKQVIVTYQTITTAILNVILNLLLIPKYSYIGASIATLISLFFAFIFLFYWNIKSEYRPSHKNLMNIYKILLSCFIVLILIYYIQHLNFVIIILFSMILYFIMIYGMKVIDNNDIKLIKKLIKV